MTLSIEIFGTMTFGLALIHTFLVKQFQHLASRYPEGSAQENLFHLLGEVEVVFGMWAGIYLLGLAAMSGTQEVLHYMEGLNFTEPVFVFVIMAICSTRPILLLASRLIEVLSKLLPLPKPIAFYVTTLTVGPWLGSFITEPAAMTVTALILLERYYQTGISDRLKYATIGLLFVNVSIGGTLTPYAAPPILMVAPKWNWDLVHMITQFGWKGMVACAVSAALITYKFRRELKRVEFKPKPSSRSRVPLWVTVTHLLFLAGVVITGHYVAIFMGLFLFFLGLASVTREYQDELRLKQGLLVGFFLAGLVVLGGPQRWWLEPILTNLETLPLYLGAISLTAITDNAALTYLGSQVPTLTEASKYALVAGSVVGGGLTVIANAPNPAGFGILSPAFDEEGISPIRLFLAALPPTIVAALAFWLL